MDKLRTVAILNWGLGLELLKAIKGLAALEVAAVITQHDAGSADPWINTVYEHATGAGYEVLDQSVLDPGGLAEIFRERRADLVIVHAYMEKIPEAALSVPRHGCINVHASLLPKYRGASPTQWVLRNGDMETGLTCHYMSGDLDGGDIIHQMKVPVNPGDTVASVVERLKGIAGPLLSESVSRVLDPEFVATVQEHSLASFAPKIRQ